MGEMKVPASAYYGAQTARAVENFPISNLRFPRSFIRALPVMFRARMAIQLAKKVVKRSYVGSRAVPKLRRGHGTLTLRNVSLVDIQTYLYYIQTQPSRSSDGVWVPYDDQA